MNQRTNDTYLSHICAEPDVLRIPPNGDVSQATEGVNRLAYADALEGQEVRLHSSEADTARAEFIRIQQRLWVDSRKHDLTNADRESLQSRSAELLKQYRYDWLSPEELAAGLHRFVAGFPLPTDGDITCWNTPTGPSLLAGLSASERTHVVLSERMATGWSHNVPGSDGIHSICYVPTGEAGERTVEFVRTLAADPGMSSLQRLLLISSGVNATALGHLCGPSSHLANLRELCLTDNPNIAGHLSILARSPLASRLRSLKLDNCNLNAFSMSAIAGPTSNLTCIRHLDLSNSAQLRGTVDRLTRSYVGENVESLNLGGCNLIEHDLSALGSDYPGMRKLKCLNLEWNPLMGRLGLLCINSDTLSGLASMNLAHCGLIPSDIRALADNQSCLKNLRHLDVSNNRDAVAAFPVLFKSPNVAGLRSLNIENLTLDHYTVAALVSKDCQLRNLRHLSMGGSVGIGDSLGRIASCQHLRTLETLDLRGTHLTLDQARPLIDAIAEGNRFPYLRSVRTGEHELDPLLEEAIQSGALRRAAVGNQSHNATGFVQREANRHDRTGERVGPG